MLDKPSQELMQGEGDFVGMRRTPRNNALELDEVVSDGADFYQLGFDALQVSHRNSSMAQIDSRKARWWSARLYPAMPSMAKTARLHRPHAPAEPMTSAPPAPM